MSKKRQINYLPERKKEKILDTDLAGLYDNIVSGTSGVFVINLVGQGSSAFTRVGKNVYPKKVQLYGYLVHTYKNEPTTGDVEGNIARILLIWDSTPSGSLPNIQDILNNESQNGTQNPTSTSIINPKNTNRFRILQDFTHVFPIQAVNLATGTDNFISNPFPVNLIFDIPSELVTTFNSTSISPSITDIATGGLYIIIKSAATMVANNFISTSSNNLKARLYYTD